MTARVPRTPAELVAAAEEAVRMSGSDPGRAAAAARDVLDRARAADCGEAVSIAHRALALTEREFGHLHRAADHLDRAVAAAGRHPERAAQARLSLVSVRAELGDPLDALRIARLAEGHLTGLDTARLGVQRAVALVQLGRAAEAVAHCDAAVALLTGGGDVRFLAGALLNRGIAHTYLERYDAARADLAACAAIARDAGLDHIAVLATGNLPFVAARCGDIPAAFAGYEAAERALAGYPERLATMRADFAGALLAAHLPGEARALLAQAVPELAAAGARVALAESRLSLAQAELLVGDPRRARAGAELAAGELAAQGRAAWVPLAEEVVLRTRLAAGPPSAALLAEARALAGRLAGQGWATAAAGLRLAAAELALALGLRGAALAELWPLTAAGAPGRTNRVLRHHAVALTRSLRGDRSGAFTALRAGLRAAATGGEPFDDPGVRAHAVRAGERLAAFGLALALSDGRPEAVLAWAEHCRAVARGHLDPPAGPNRDGPPPWPAGTAHAGSDAEPRGLEQAARLGGELAGAALVEFVRHGDRLSAVVVTAGRCVLRPLGSGAAAAEATIRLRYAMRRAGLRDTGGPSDVRGAAEALASRLLRPLAADIADRPLVIVPTGALHTVPWPALPPLHGRPVCVASSAQAWAATARAIWPGDSAGEVTGAQADAGRGGAGGDGDRRDDDGRDDGPGPGDLRDRGGGPAAGRARGAGPRVVAVAGPGLRHAEAEAAMVVRTHRARHGAARAPARTADVLGALGRAEIVHVAAHGVFCAGSPLLSGITLDDGPLMAYDLLRPARVPRLVVLSACDAGMAHAPVDGAPLGLAGTLVDRGAACVVAGLVPIRDEDALALMTAFHELLARGRTPAEALAAAGERTGVRGLACFGSLGRPLFPPPRPAV
ncbi:hypothetical protein Sru01_48250 [Sphaerisporangium rufum]|uniref:CHAT domain-containing protein n=1 Tax=Sphaerisporangium rufum TaxID=1381558 RepID=A0A919V3A2_9ACTN|nr:CHAT domain-containing protein [Sphaerisporangium rufum]GII79843.1 hypothetical protein Sru01_48250 [Sphaerisporangium rufum]